VIGIVGHATRVGNEIDDIALGDGEVQDLVGAASRFEQEDVRPQAAGEVVGPTLAIQRILCYNII
jgi:hypothetical protein